MGESVMPEYSQGICGDGAAILKDGVMLTIDEIVAELNAAAQHERIVDGLEARLAEAAEIASLARDYVSSDLVFKRDAFKGYEHCSDVTDVEADLSRIDAFLAQTAEGVK